MNNFSHVSTVITRMKTLDLKLTRIGNSKGVRLPAEVIRRFGFSESLAAEVREEGLLLKPKKRIKLSWEETAREMAASDENWTEWDAAVADGIETCPWEEQLPVHVQAWVRASAGFSRAGKGAKRKTNTKVRAQA